MRSVECLVWQLERSHLKRKIINEWMADDSGPVFCEVWMYVQTQGTLRLRGILGGYSIPIRYWIICGWLMVIPWSVSYSGCRGWLLRNSDYFLYGYIDLLWFQDLFWLFWGCLGSLRMKVIRCFFDVMGSFWRCLEAFSTVVGPFTTFLLLQGLIGPILVPFCYDLVSGYLTPFDQI